MLQRVLSIIFPRTCLSCGSWGDYFCDICSSKLIFSVQKPICPVCTKPSVGGATHPQCKTRYTIDGLVSLFRYKEGVRKGIQKVKYSRQFDIAQALTTNALAIIDRDINEYYIGFDWFVRKRSPTIVPIPLHWRKKRSRWFNQSDYYAKTIAKHYNLSFNTKLLIRNKYRSAQTHLNRKQRLKNVKRVFEVPYKSLIKNQSILLIDDVWTTGSTMREAANTLKRAGAERVWGLTIAR